MSCKETFEPVNYDLFLPIVTGDTYPESINFTTNDINSVLNRVTIGFKRSPLQSVADLTLDSVSGGITIVSSSGGAWSVNIGSFNVTLTPGEYYYQIKCYYGSSSKRSILSGVLQVKDSI